MNQELPKPLREALARQPGDDLHPSADALTAFVERSLSQGESRRVTDHLAQCSDCRETVFLASNAVKSESSRAGISAPAESLPRRSWRLRWLRASVAVGVVIVAGVVLWQIPQGVRSTPTDVSVLAPLPSAATPQQRAPAVPPARESGAESTGESRTALALQKPPAKTARAKTNQRGSAETAAEGAMTVRADQNRLAPLAGAAPQPASPPPPTVLGGVVQSLPAVAPTQNAFVEGQAQGASGALARPQQAFAPQAAMHTVTAVHFQWRISTDGHLERSTAPGSWIRALADQPVVFHVVSVVGSNVWAGGNGGALFHSGDGGQTWSKTLLSSSSGVETSTITAIHFSDALQGSVKTDGGSQWSTSDGGVSWTKE